MFLQNIFGRLLLCILLFSVIICFTLYRSKMTKVAHVNVAATIFFSKFKTKIKYKTLNLSCFYFCSLSFWWRWLSSMFSRYDQLRQNCYTWLFGKFVIKYILFPRENNSEFLFYLASIYPTLYDHNFGIALLSHLSNLLSSEIWQFWKKNQKFSWKWK